VECCGRNAMLTATEAAALIAAAKKTNPGRQASLF
jgi:hypothetical protein